MAVFGLFLAIFGLILVSHIQSYNFDASEHAEAPWCVELLCKIL